MLLRSRIWNKLVDYQAFMDLTKIMAIWGNNSSVLCSVMQNHMLHFIDALQMEEIIFKNYIIQIQNYHFLAIMVIFFMYPLLTEFCK